jgi:hypothetical protein
MRLLQRTGLLLVLLGCPAFAAQPRGFTFTKIADNAGPAVFLFSGGLNDRGTVAITVNFEGGGYAVLVGDGRTLSTVAQTPVGSFGRARIDSRGDVVFRAGLPGGEAILLVRQGRISTLVDSSGPFHFLIGDPVVNAQGTVAFFATLDSGAEGIFALEHERLTTIADNTGTFVTFAPPDDINRRGQVVFRADPDDPERATIVVGDGRKTRIAADASGSFEFFTGAAINESGTVAFSVLLADGSQGIFLADPRGGISPVVTSDGPFETLTITGLTNAGTPVFTASLDTGENGVFVGPDPIADRVIATGDMLDGAAVRFAFPSDVNSSGQIALVVIFEDGTVAVYRTQHGSVR